MTFGSILHIHSYNNQCVVFASTVVSTMHLNVIQLPNQPLTTGYGSSRPHSIVPAHSYTGGCIRLVTLITHMGGHRHKLPPTVAGHINNTIEYGNGGHSILVLLTLGVNVIWIEGALLSVVHSKDNLFWGTIGGGASSYTTAMRT